MYNMKPASYTSRAGRRFKKRLTALLIRRPVRVSARTEFVGFAKSSRTIFLSALCKVSTRRGVKRGLEVRKIL